MAPGRVAGFRGRRRELECRLVVFSVGRMRNVAKSIGRYAVWLLFYALTAVLGPFSHALVTKSLHGETLAFLAAGVLLLVFVWPFVLVCIGAGAVLVGFVSGRRVYWAAVLLGIATALLAWQADFVAH